MLLEHKFTVPVPPDDAWVVLLDLERVAPCMPGATLESVDDDGFTGKVRVKVGPITVTYVGKGKFTERDEAAHRVVIEAAGRETRGSGTAAATVTAALESRGTGETEVLVSTDLAITGRPAQFGRGVMSEVGAKLIGTFAECLAGKITGGDEPASVPAAAEVEAAPIDLLDVAGESVARKVLPPVIGLAAAAIALSWWIRRRRR